MPLFKPASRYPADPRAVFVLALCVFSGVPLILGVAKPGSLEAQLPHWAVQVWGVLLTAGALVTLLSLKFKGPGGVAAEQVGSVTVGVATAFYSVALVVLAGWDAFPAAGITFGWGLACIARWGQLQALIRVALHAQANADMRREIASEASDR